MAVRPPGAGAPTSPELAMAAQRVDQAAADLRDRPDGGWDQVRQQVLAVVRRARRWSFPIRGDAVSDSSSDPDATGSVLVGEQVLRVLLGRAVSAAHPCTADDIRLTLDRLELRGVEVVLRARYGQDLHALADGVRATVLEVLTEVLGPGVSLRVVSEVGVRIEDITVADPRTV